MHLPKWLRFRGYLQQWDKRVVPLERHSTPQEQVGGAACRCAHPERRPLGWVWCGKSQTGPSSVATQGIQTPHWSSPSLGTEETRAQCVWLILRSQAYWVSRCHCEKTRKHSLMERISGVTVTTALIYWTLPLRQTFCEALRILCLHKVTWLVQDRCYDLHFINRETGARGGCLLKGPRPPGGARMEFQMYERQGGVLNVSIIFP